MDAVPVTIHVPAEASCSDRERAAALLAELLSGSQAPRHGRGGEGSWHLSMGVSKAEGGTMRAEAELRDDAGHVVASRTVNDRGGRCEALASAVGAWAQLELDEAFVAASATRSTTSSDRSARSSDRGAAPTPVVADDRPTLDTAGLANEKPEPTDGRGVEVGATAFLRGGVARTGGLVGFSPFLTFALTDRWLLRPSLLYASSREGSSPADSIAVSALGGRVDFCGRIPGNYIRRRGIELDMCMGSDVVHLWSTAGSVQRASLGPAATLRGQLGLDLALEIRTMAGVTLNRASLPDEWSAPPLLTAVELGVSRRFE